jgi:hypothetical protein
MSFEAKKMEGVDGEVFPSFASFWNVVQRHVEW